MLAVVDTNVWVSALLTPRGRPAQLLAAFNQGHLTVAYNREIELEYRAVLARPRLAIDPALRDAFSLLLSNHGYPLPSGTSPPPGLPDPDDWPFMAAALAAACPLVTGNARHYPPGMGLTILSPAQCLERLNTPG